MGKYDVHNMRVVERWERGLLTPPEDYDYEECSCCGEPLIDKVYSLKGEHFCEDCAKEMCEVYAEDDEPVECCYCEEPIDDECYFEVGGDVYCEKCFEKAFQE